MKPQKRSTKKVMTLVCLVALLTFGILLKYTAISDASSNAIQAPSFIVNTTGDTSDGSCDPVGTGDGCTLREAITLANSNAGVDTISFDATVFAAPGPHVIQLTSALPDVESDMDITGPGARVLSVRGEGASDRYRIFTINAGVTVNISGLTATNGHTADGAAGFNGGEGGGIRNAGTLTLTGVAVAGNRTGNGGSSAASGGVGGGIRNLGTLAILNSTISGNLTGDGGPDPDAAGGTGGTGGGISNGLGSLTITNSTISGNQTGNGGGGLLTGSRGEGGGIHTGNAALTISNSTITANSAGGGGGIRRNGSGTVTLRSNIIAVNSANAGPDIRGDVQSDGYNLIGNTANAVINLNSGAGPDITGVDPQLNSLANNGGPTDTHSLKSSSPAIDKGSAFGSTTDQRNFTRPVDLDDATYPDASGGDATDIGAYEVQANDPNLFPIAVNTTADTNDGDCTTIGTGNGCTLREAITFANNFPGTQTITFDATVFGSAQTIILGSALPDISTDMIIDGPGAALLTVSGNDAFRVFNVNPAITVTIQDLTIRDGNAIGSDGGGLRNSGTLTLANVAIISSTASNGGGVYTNGSLTTINSTFSDNSSIGSGGGVFNNGSLIATNSTFNGNSSGSGGGGIFNLGTLIVTNSTLSGNSATSGGGGISNANTMRLRNTIVANSAGGGDCSGTATAHNSLVEDGTCGVTNGVNGNRTGVDPQLGTLTGSPAYFPLGGVSSARNAGNNFFVSEADDDGASSTDIAVDYNGDGDTTDTLTTDQAGEARIANGTVDMGSTEVNAIIVNLTTNVSDTNAADGVCDTSAAAGEQCTLRAAVQTANAIAGTETIVFDPTVFAGAQTITITNGLPDITSNMTIAGTGQSLLTLSGSGGTTRLFIIGSGTTVTIQDLTASGSSTNNGGALFNNGGTLTLNRITFSSNTSLTTTAGGAVYNSSGTTMVNNCTFTGNTAGGSGGAIHIQTGTVRVTNSIFTNNTSNATNAATGGGAIYGNSGSTLFVTGSSFSGNSVPSGGYGGAIMFANSPGVITNSTITGNTAANGGGGGINTTNPSALVTIINTTISGNNAAAGLGGGIRRGGGTTTLRNSIVANSTAGGDCITTGAAPIFNNSLVEDGSCGIVNGANGNKTGDPALDTLTNGYHPLTLGSIARDAGNNTFLSEATSSLDFNGDGDQTDTLTTDQAGAARIFNTTVDMGAVELVVRDFVVDRTDDTVVDTCTAAANDCTLRGAITLASSLAGADTITFDATVFAAAQTITLGSALPNITTPMTIDGSGTGGVTISGVDTHRPFSFQNTTATLQDLTIRDGLAAGGQGGGIHVNTGSVTLRRVTVTSCTANFGGGIFNLSGGTLFVFDSAVIDNHANNNGGGILNAGVMYMMNTAVLDNSANSQGGGIMSTSSANLTNVTVTGNTANTTAGMYFSNGTSTLTNITVAGNTASNQIGGVQRFSGNVVVRNSIFANNTGVDCYQTMSVTNSLVETQDGSFPCGVTNGVNGNLLGQDPQLGALTNGYFPLLTGSPARQAGNNFFINEADDDGAGTVDGAIDFNGDGDTTDILTIDQAGNPRIINITVDMGATEGSDIVPPQVSSIVRASVDPTSSNTSVSFSVNFSEDVTGVDATDFVVTVTSGSLLGPSVTGVTGTGAARTVTVNTGIGSGTLRLDLIDDDTITDAANNKLGGTGAGNGNFTGGQFYTVNASDTVTSPLVVTKTADTNDNVCDADCSLREAITVANADPGVETINFAAALTSGGPATINLSSALPNLSTDINISGPGAQLLTVARSGAIRFRIFTVTTGVTINISRLTVTGGFTANGGAPGQPGGGILNSGTLTLTGVVVSGNQSGPGAGCANCTGGNGGSGGGISNAGTLNLVSSTVSGNQTGNGGNGINANGIGGNGGSGAGIANSGILTVINSTISGNQTGARGTGNLGNGIGGDGGGISNGGTLTVINTTISGNNATENAGGVDVTSGGATIINSTITNNRADSDTAGNPAVGGGLRLSGNTILRNTIVAGNFIEAGTTDTNSDISGAVDGSSSHNLVGVDTGITGITNDNNGNQIGTAASPINPLLGPLANNGGPTQTHALLNGSPAIEAGNNANLPLDTLDLDGDSDTGETLPVDQRGVGFARVVDSGDANSTQTVDIGAFELQISIEDITDKTTAEDTAVPQITFNVGSGSIQSVTATSNNTTLIPNANIAVNGSGPTRTLDITPAANANTPADSTATITVTVTATDGSTAVDTFVVTVTEVNDAPVPTTDTVSDVAEDSGVYSIPFTTLLTNDTNKGAPNESSQTVNITAVSSPVGGTVQINGSNVEFTPNPNSFGPASFVYTVTDNGTTNGVSDPSTGNATVSFNVNGINEPPVNTVPGPQSTNQDTPITFSSGNGNQISVVDSDGNAFASSSKKKGGIRLGVIVPLDSGPLSTTMQITLSVTNGTLTLSGITGLSFTFSDGNGTGVGDGTADATMTFRGTIADINVALNGMFFTPASGFSGTAVLTITSNDLGNTGTGGPLTDTDTVNIQVSNDIRIQDARVAEPTSGTTNMLFTVALSAPAGAGGVQVTYQSAVGGSHPATPGSDYNHVGPTVLTFAAGQKTKTIAVPVLADADTTETNETLVVTLSSPSNGTVVNGTATGTIIHANIPGSFLISELRTSGPGGAGDDFVEFYNNSDSPLTVAATDASAGYGLFKKGADCNATPVLVGVIPNGTVIPARGHYLMVGSQYSLTAYAAGNLTLSSDIESDANVAIFSTSDAGGIASAARLDAVGFGTNTGGVCDLLREGTNIPATGGPMIEYSFHRDSCGKGGSSTIMGVCTVFTPIDNNNNNPDFLFADTQSTFIAGHPQRLGAPGPENLAGPILRNSSMVALFLDQTVAQSLAPNRVRDFTPVTNGTFGTLTFRRRVQNNTGGNVTRLRFKIIDITSFPASAGFADLRALSSVNVVVSGVNDSATCLAANGVATTPCNVTVSGTTLETPANQPNGGAWNSTYSAGTITLGTPLANGASANLQFMVGVQQTGAFKFYINIEALP